MKKSRMLIVLAGIVGLALAGGVSIDASKDGRYGGLTNVSGTSVSTDFDIRVAGMTQAAGVYRDMNGLSSLPSGSTFTMTWPNGSRETGSIISPYSTMGATPVPGTQTQGSNNICYRGNTPVRCPSPNLTSGDATS